MTADSPTTAPARILLIDDEPAIRRFLRISLRSQGYTLLEADTGAAGLIAAANERPDLVILDLGLPDQDGQQVLAELRAWSAVPVLVLSVRDGEADKVRALDAGANDYVTKPFGIAEFLARVRGLLRLAAAPPGPAGRFQDGHLDIDLGRRRVTRDGAPVHLTRKEYAVLTSLVANRGRLVTQAQLLREHWGSSHVADTHYLRIVIGKLRQKLGDDPVNPRYLETEPGVGYRFLTPAADGGPPGGEC